jgi:hypothetical protein
VNRTTAGSRKSLGVVAALCAAMVQSGCQSTMTRTVQQSVTLAADTARMCRPILPGAESTIDPTSVEQSGVALGAIDLLNLEVRFDGRFDPDGMLFNTGDKVLAPNADNPFTKLNGLEESFAGFVKTAKETRDEARALGKKLFASVDAVAASGRSEGQKETLIKVGRQLNDAREDAKVLTEKLAELGQYYEAFERSLAEWRIDPAARANQRQLEAVTKVRAYHQVVTQMLPTLEAASAGHVRAMLSAMAQRELGLASRVAFRMVLAAIKGVDRQLAAVDERLSGGLGAYLFIADADIADADLKPILRATGCELGCSLGSALLQLGVSPEAVTAEACSSLYSTDAQIDHLKVLGTLVPDLYAGLVDGVQQACDGKKGADGKTGVSVASHSAASNQAAVTSLRAEWTAALAFERINAPGPPRIDDGAAERRERHTRWWMMSASAATSLEAPQVVPAPLPVPAPSAAAPPTVPPAPTRGAPKNLSMAELAGSIDHLASAVRARTMNISNQPPPSQQGPSEEHRELMLRLAEVQKALASREQLYTVGQDMAALCAIASADGVLQRGAKFTARCPPQNANSEHAYNVATVVITAEFPEGEWDVGPYAPLPNKTDSPPLSLTKPPNKKTEPSLFAFAELPEESVPLWRLMTVTPPDTSPDKWDLNVWRDDLKKTGAAGPVYPALVKYERMRELEVPLTHLAEVLNSTVHGAGMVVTVYGFASAKKYSCTKLATQILASRLRTKTCDKKETESCYELKVDANGPQVTIKADGRRESRTCADSNANSMLSAARSWSVVSLLRTTLDRDRWTVQMARDPFQNGTGTENMQTIVLQIRPGR